MVLIWKHCNVTCSVHDVNYQNREYIDILKDYISGNGKDVQKSLQEWIRQRQKENMHVIIYSIF